MSKVVKILNEHATPHLKRLSEKLSERLLITYLISISIGTTIFLIIMFVFGWNLGIFTSLPFFVFFTVISGTTMKFLGGLGMSLTYLTICIFFFKLFSKKMKGRKVLVQRMKLVFTILSTLFIIYGIYIFITGLLKFPDTIFEILTQLILGMFTLIISVYLIPVARDLYQPFHKETRGEKIKGKLGNVKYSLWKGYKSRIRKDYGTVQAAEYQRLKDDIDEFRSQLSAILLIPLIFALTLFLPFIGIAIVIWIRLFSLDKKPFTNIERVLLIVVMSTILVISTIVFLFVYLAPIIPIFNTAYAIGLWCSVAIFLHFLYKR
ncbi:MAG: hypothetical protein EAX96_08525 [Candidatus Lokiarchaeota archaeon]|nr:hypothetical protein [Candidatus Lokiarchaeota archaeon]